MATALGNQPSFKSIIKMELNTIYPFTRGVNRLRLNPSLVLTTLGGGGRNPLPTQQKWQLDHLELQGWQSKLVKTTI